METTRNRRSTSGQANVWLALIIAVLALVIAIWAWVRADPELAAEVDLRVAEVRQEMSQQADAFQQELEELRAQLVEADGDDQEDDEEDEEEDGN